MQKIRVEILPPAWDELEQISDFHLQAVGSKSAENITDKILMALDRLELFPLSAPLLSDVELRLQGYRGLVCGSYLCIYQFVADTVYVCHIIHGAKEYSKLFTRENSADK